MAYSSQKKRKQDTYESHNKLEGEFIKMCDSDFAMYSLETQQGNGKHHDQPLFLQGIISEASVTSVIFIRQWMTKKPKETPLVLLSVYLIWKEKLFTHVMMPMKKQ